MFGKKKKFEEDSETMTYLEPEESQKSLLDEWEAVSYTHLDVYKRQRDRHGDSYAGSRD